ncbi:MAG: hypothetical protein U0V70_20670 [Terriglobia bacterium]
MLGRRKFVEILANSTAAAVIAPAADAWGTPDASQTIDIDNWQLRVAPSGEIVSLQNGKLELIRRQLGSNSPRIVFLNKKIFDCNQPKASRREGSTLFFDYAFSDRIDFQLHYAISFVRLNEGQWVLTQRLGLDFPAKVNENVKLWLPRTIQLPFENRMVFVPLKNGIGRRKPVLGLDSDDEYVFQLSGSHDVCRPQWLAIPMVDEYSGQTDLHLTHCTDPYFTSYFSLPYRERIGQFHCVFPDTVALNGHEERRVYTVLHQGEAKTALKLFYACALSDVKPGPDWMHDVAMVDYDYLSKNGQGWFADIDTLKDFIPVKDRSKVFLGLHGWYDVVGRYSFNYPKQTLDKEWTAFPGCQDKDFQAYGDAPELGDPYRFHKQSISRMRPVAMSIAEMHRRLRYAKDNGFRVGLYFSDGLLSGTEVKDHYEPTKVLSWGGWKGPDTQGRTFLQNPLHPEVRNFYLSYMKTLLSEFGKELDGFLWDETHYIGPGTLGNDSYPGYADRGMMMLIKEIGSMVASFNPELALFSSDNIGLWNLTDRVPYALVAHGTYQDSACRPEAWSWGLFPNHRNVLWSCNWAPLSRLDFTRYAVETFSMPVAISNGSFGDDVGISEMGKPTLHELLALFAKQKQRKMELGWVEEDQCHPTYDGKPILYRWSF